MLRVGCTGGRKYADKTKVFQTLDKLLTVRQDFVIIVGDAKGADELVRQWCELRNVPVEVYYADWDTYGKAAGPMRNRAMLESGIKYLVAFPGNAGTKDMTTICKKSNIVVLEVK
jgi:hypothetical protein